MVMMAVRIDDLDVRDDLLVLKAEEVRVPIAGGLGSGPVAPAATGDQPVDGVFGGEEELDDLLSQIAPEIEETWKKGMTL
ncbi:MAG: hypothetical protein KatS3mg111_3106 [Pirellulaceae bacterium]|nr:MAG: hypothetical protein KatS3mg111_3106 [Pirellulaceae bacterium]